MTPKRTAIKAILLEAFLIAGTALLLALAARAFAPPPRLEPATGPSAVEEIEQETLKLIMAQDPHLLLDARPADSFLAGHLPGALSLPAYEFDTFFPQISPRISPDLTIIVYCSSISCQDADLLAEALSRQGVDNILLYRGGFADWAETGNTVVSGDVP
jgi:rhodanese-related sulfurtransferase